LDTSIPLKSVKDIVENLLFLSQEPLSLKRLADSLPYSKEEIAAALDALQAEYQDRALKLRFASGGWQLTTDSALADEVEDFFNIQRKRRLSRQALETLTVIAYNQPVTRSGIEAIRGVSTSGTLQTLTECGLIRVIGQKDTLGNPYLYGTTDEFLRHFGLGDVTELPPLEFEREGLTAPTLRERDIEGDGSEKQDSDAGEITPVDFGMTDETAEIPANVQQKGA